MQPSADLSDATGLLKSLGTACALGLLVGLQREWVNDRIAGIRTFALIGLFGGLAGVLGQVFGGWLVAAALVACAAILLSGNVVARDAPDADPGMTTEIAALVVFAVGVLAASGQQLVAVACAGTVLVLLQGKDRLHAMVRQIGEDDLREIVRLVLLGLVILPVLPNRDMGYLGLFNPFKVWLIVVLMVGISLTAYLAAKFIGGTRATALAGILGGLISSTATTASVSQRSRQQPGAARSLAAITLTAACIVFIRVIVEVFLTAPAEASRMLPPLLAMLLWMALIAFASLRVAREAGSSPASETTPSELKGAVLFALLYLAVLHGVALAKHHFGDSGLYVVAAISGLSDMDAITLSTSRLVATGNASAETGWKVILTGGLANLIFKGALVTVLGSGAYVRRVWTGFLAGMAGGAAILAFWP